jgi:hypothetical protein
MAIHIQDQDTLTHCQSSAYTPYCNISFARLLLFSTTIYYFILFLLIIMSHNRYMSWSSDVLTMAPTYPPAGAAVEYPSPVSRRPSECYSEATASRRGSAAGFASDMEGKGQWQNIGSNSDSKSPLANFAFFKGLTEKKTTRGLCSGSLSWPR